MLLGTVDGGMILCAHLVHLTNHVGTVEYITVILCEAEYCVVNG